MLSKRNRLPLRQEIGKMKKEGKYIPGDILNLLIVRRQENLCPRFACLITSKVAKKAVIRNRVRRLIWEAIRSFLQEVRAGADVLITAKNPIVTQGLIEIQSDMRKSFQKAGLIALKTKEETEKK